MVEERKTPGGCPYKVFVVYTDTLNLNFDEDNTTVVVNTVKEILDSIEREMPLLIDLQRVRWIDSKSINVLISLMSDLREKQKKGWWKPSFLFSKYLYGILVELKMNCNFLSFLEEENFQNDYEKSCIDETDNKKKSS